MWIPEDGVADSYKICLSLLEAAKQKGVWQLFAFVKHYLDNIG